MTAPLPVVLTAHGGGAELVEGARAAERLAGGPVAGAVAWAATAGADVPVPGRGATLRRWELLATVAAVDLAVARVLEPHLDALAILDEAGLDHGPGTSWGVYAAEDPRARLEASRADDGSWSLTGRKAWCSLAEQVSHALVTAWVSDHERSMFVLDLRDERVEVEDGAWSAYALAGVTTSSLRVHGAPGRAVGAPGWYLDRPGFAWGGAGVAAVWYGGAVGLARRLHAGCTAREPDQVALMHLGAVDAALGAARASLVLAAGDVDAGRATGADGAVVAARVRQVVADAAEEVTSRVGHALGPGPLAHEPRHARRVADLALYLRQHHAERDQAALGRALLGLGTGDVAGEGGGPVVTFSHDRPGTPAAAWHEDPRWDAIPSVEPWRSDDGLGGGRPARLVVVAAHPDDESLGAGGTVAISHDRGLRVEVVVATHGEASHPRSPTHDRAALAAVRSAEATDAVAVLAPGGAPLLLGLPDGALAEHEGELVRVLVERVGDGRGVLLLAPWRRDGHPDHEAAGRAAATAAARTGARLLEYPVWFWHWGDPGSAPWSRWRAVGLDEGARRRKAAAVAAHRSQVTPLSDQPGDETLLGPDLLAHFGGDREVLVVEQTTDDSLDRLHADHEDPWQVGTRFYEQRKRDLLLAALPRPRFDRALEVGCSTGAVTAALADRCDALVALDSSPHALAAARHRLTGAGVAGGVELRRAAVPEDWPTGRFDLVVLSEVGYFLSVAALEELVGRVRDCLTGHGVVVLAHWRHPVEGWPLDGADVHEAFTAPGGPCGGRVLAQYRDRDVDLLLLGPADALPDPRG